MSTSTDRPVPPTGGEMIATVHRLYKALLELLDAYLGGPVLIESDQASRLYVLLADAIENRIPGLPLELQLNLEDWRPFESLRVVTGDDGDSWEFDRPKYASVLGRLEAAEIRSGEEPDEASAATLARLHEAVNNYARAAAAEKERAMTRIIAAAKDQAYGNGGRQNTDVREGLSSLMKQSSSVDNPDELLRTLLERRAEARDLDFKAPMEWPRTPEKFDLIRDVLALSNSVDGGYLVFGVEDRTFRLIGLTDNQADTFDQTIVYDAVKAFGSPPPTLQLFRGVVDGKLFVGIRVDEFSDLPTVCKETQKVGSKEVLRKGSLYVRTGGAQTVEINNEHEMRQLLELVVRKKLDARGQDLPPEVSARDREVWRAAYTDQREADRRALDER